MTAVCIFCRAPIADTALDPHCPLGCRGRDTARRAGARAWQPAFTSVREEPIELELPLELELDRLEADLPQVDLAAIIEAAVSRALSNWRSPT